VWKIFHRFCCWALSFDDGREVFCVLAVNMFDTHSDLTDSKTTTEVWTRRIYSHISYPLPNFTWRQNCEMWSLLLTTVTLRNETTYLKTKKQTLRAPIMAVCPHKTGCCLTPSPRQQLRPEKRTDKACWISQRAHAKR